MRIPFISQTVMLVLLFSSLAALAAGDPEAGSRKAQICAACHGPDGNSTNPAWPSLAGQHAEYTGKQLHDFRDGRRANPQMSPMAAPLSDQDIADLAAFYSSQKTTLGVVQPENVEPGQKIYRAGDPRSGLPACMACHGPNGTGNPAAAYPALSGQHADYTRLQLKAYKAEERSNDPSGIMRSVASKLTGKDIEAISDYLQGLH